MAALATTALLAIVGLAPTLAADRSTICSITINSREEIDTFRRHLPASSFDFVELTDHARNTPDGRPDGWLRRACESGVRCDVLVLSGHFGDTWAGRYATTFAGDSGLTLPLDELERHSCADSCPGILRSPKEVFLLGCRTLAFPLAGTPLSKSDLVVLAGSGVPNEPAERLAEEARYGTSDISNRRRMRFVFAGVPHLYGFSEVAPSGKRAEPILEAYFRNVGDYAAHLGRLGTAQNKNRKLAAAFRSSTFAETDGLPPGDPERDHEARSCVLRNEDVSTLARLEHMEKLVTRPDFPTYLPVIEPFLGRHQGSFGPAELEVLRRLGTQEPARQSLIRIVAGLEAPLLRKKALTTALKLGWTGGDDAVRVAREIVVRTLRPPVYQEGRDIVCGIEPEILSRITIGADDVQPGVYGDEFGIQALGCLKPSDERIHLALANALSDPREWIAQRAAGALKAIKPTAIEVQLALARQLSRADGGARSSAGEALREIKAADPRVLATIRETDPSFSIDWL